MHKKNANLSRKPHWFSGHLYNYGGRHSAKIMSFNIGTAQMLKIIDIFITDQHLTSTSAS